MNQNKSIFDLVTAIFKSKEKAVTIANRINKIYADRYDTEPYVPFGFENPQKIAVNLASLYAAATCVNIIAVIRSGLGKKRRIAEYDYIQTLIDICEGRVSPKEIFIAESMANLAWRAIQPFIDIESDPLNCIAGDINIEFNQLTDEQRSKDYLELREAAHILWEEWDRHSTPE